MKIILKALLSMSLACPFMVMAFQAPPLDTMRGGINNNQYLPNQLPKDRQISQQVQQLFRQDYDVGPYADFIQVYTIEGIVTLSGRVDDNRVRLNAESIARRPSGVRQVINNIELVYGSDSYPYRY